MSWLIWKDYRVNRLIFILAAVLLVLPHVVIAMGSWYQTGTSLLVEKPALLLYAGCFWSLIVLQLVLAFTGGNMLATERVDRSAEFLGYLPISRRRILASKLFVTVLLTAIVWVPQLVVVLITSPMVGPNFNQAVVLAAVATTGLTFFCVAWLFSSILTSPTFSVCLGLITPLALYLCIAWAVLKFGVSPETLQHRENYSLLMLYWYHGLCLPISAVCFAAGSLCFLRRVEP